MLIRFLVALLVVTISGPALAQDYGNWRKSERTSEMDDFKNVYFSVRADEDIPRSHGMGTVRPTLLIRCMENRTTIYVNWGRYITTGGVYINHQVRYRIDDRDPVQANWSISTNFESTGEWRGRGISLLRSMKGATRFLVETTPYGENSVLASFDVTGFDAAAAEVAERCHWSF